MTSEYCKICKLFETCVEVKTCSCDKFTTDVDLKRRRK